MRTPKKITWEYLFKYCCGKKKICDSIFYFIKDKYYIGFSRAGQMKLYQNPNWWEKFIILNRKMSYEEMLDVMQQLKRSEKDKFYNLRKSGLICNHKHLKVEKATEK